jgi:hypothetical protein
LCVCVSQLAHSGKSYQTQAVSSEQHRQFLESNFKLAVQFGVSGTSCSGGLVLGDIYYCCTHSLMYLCSKQCMPNIVPLVLLPPPLHRTPDAPAPQGGGGAVAPPLPHLLRSFSSSTESSNSDSDDEFSSSASGFSSDSD